MAKKPEPCGICGKPSDYGIEHEGKKGRLCRVCVNLPYEAQVKKIWGGKKEK